MPGRTPGKELIEENVLERIDTQGLIKFTQRLIQFQTINPPAEYAEISSFLQETLSPLGMETHILEGHPGKKNVFGLFRGASQEKVLLLSGHMDVVPAGDKEKWIYNPFEAEIHDGRLWCRVSTKGKAAHGGEPDLGINAIDHMIKLVQRFHSVLHLKHPLMGRDTLNLGVIEGGQKVNIVPDLCTAHIDLRMCSPGSSDEYENSLRGMIQDLKNEVPEIEVSEFDIYERRDPIEMDRTHPFIHTMEECIRRVCNKEPQYLGSLSAGDLYHTMKNGIPGAWIGPGNAQFLHQANERIRVDDIIDAAKIYALLILRYCM